MSEIAQDFDSLFTSALAYHRAGQHSEAAQHYLHALEINPNHIGALFNLAALTAADGDLDSAAVCYEKILEILPSEPDTLTNLGNLRQVQGRFDEAEDCYRKALAVNPMLPQVHSNLGNLLSAQGRHEDAVPCLQQALKLDDSQGQVHSSLGVAYWHLGKVEDAEQAFETALKHEPDDPEIRSNLANVQTHMGKSEQAEEHYRAAIDSRPEWPQAYFNLALLTRNQGRGSEAETLFRKVLELQPEHLDAVNGLAQLLYDGGDEKGAIALFDAYLDQTSDETSTAFHIGNLFHAKKKWVKATKYFRRALELNDSIADIYNNLGATLHADSKFGEAIEILEAGLTKWPDNILLHNSLGNSLSSLQRKDDAIKAYSRAVALEPTFEMAVSNLGNALREAGRFDESYKVLDEGLQRIPDSPNIHNTLGLLLNNQARHEESVKYFKSAIELKPKHLEARNNLALAYQALGHYFDALEVYRDLLSDYPDQPEVLFNLGNVLQVMGRFDESVVTFKKALEARPGYRIAYSYLAHSLMQTCNWTNLEAVTDRMISLAQQDIDADRIPAITGFELLCTSASMDLRHGVAKAAARRTAMAVKGISEGLHFDHGNRMPKDKIRVGYVSPDFRFHSVAVAFKGLLERHSRDEFEYCGYSLSPVAKDEMTEYFAENFDRFHDISKASLADAAKLIYDDGIDILIDLAGPTRFSRPGIFALKPAPIQAHYLGYSSTVGGDYIQYLITDPRQVKPGMEQYFAEELVYLPDTFMATTKSKIDPDPVTREGCGLPENGFVFANFNSHYKFDPKMFSIWMRLLKRIPDSVLWLIQGTEVSRANLRREAEVRGVAPDRLIFAESIKHEFHLSRQRLVGLALDNLYHGGGVTTTDSLWVGTPVLTVAGDSPPSRNGATLLTAVGLEELVTESIEEYEELAYELATDPDRLAAIKQKLKVNIETAALFDAERLTRHLEEAYRLMWANHEEGNAPQTIRVPLAEEYRS